MFTLISGFVFCLACLSPVVIAVVNYFKDQHGLKRFPGPFLAKFSRIWLARAARTRKRYSIIHDLHKKHGSIVRIAPDELSIADVDALDIVMGHGTKHTKSEFYDAFVSVHAGVFNTRSRADHARKRKLISAAFSPKNIVEFQPLVSAHLLKFVKQWDKLAAKSLSGERTTINCLPWMHYLTFDIVSDLAFGEPFGMIESGSDIVTFLEPTGQVKRLSAVGILDERGEYSSTTGCLPSILRPIWTFLDARMSICHKSAESLNGMSRNYVAKRLTEGNVNDRKDILACLQEGKDSNGLPMGKDEMMVEATTQLVGGSDTTSNTLTVIIWWVLKHPEVHKKLVSELDEKLGDHDGALGNDDSKKLPYLNACIREASRIHSPFSLGLPRIMSEDVNYKGYLLRKGMVCSVPVYEIHHDPKIWGDPFVFRPERWLVKDIRNLEKAFIPFSVGPRACVGRNLANLELQSIIATIFSRYDMTLEGESKECLKSKEYFLNKPVACWVSLKPRN
ncbi:cytochrome P450 [Phakopsora pachyrhizi]|uniref:Cytochrome P450 n=1 Tax=Phakopsora pachyrhizi TaxID=170000 RepID=A0A0S1MJU3_PHAPC|nr:cytochrome P450 [Phakopsora pachyrhizi]